MKPWLRATLRLIGPMVFLAVIWMTDLSHVGRIWKQGEARLLTLAAGLNVVIILVKAWRWRRLMLMQGIEFGYGASARAYAVACALAAWTPGRLGDFSKAVTVHRSQRVGLGRAAAAVIADRLLDAVALALVAAAGAMLLPGGGGIWLASAGVLMAVAGAWILARRGGFTVARQGAVSFAGRFARLKSGGAAGEQVGVAFDELAGFAKPGLTGPVLATAAATLVTFLQGYLVARGLGLAVSFWTLSAGLAAVSIASLLPVSVAGLGTREATLALYLAPRGLGMSSILGFSVAYFVVVSGSLALIGAGAWMIRPAESTVPAS